MLTQAVQLHCLRQHPDKVDFSLMLTKRVCRNLLWLREGELLKLAEQALITRLQTEVMSVEDINEGKLLLAQWPLC